MELGQQVQGWISEVDFVSLARGTTDILSYNIGLIFPSKL
jgi:hypothetical protein